MRIFNKINVIVATAAMLTTATSCKKLLEENSDSINLSSYPKGTYMLVITFENGKSTTQKVTKQ